MGHQKPLMQLFRYTRGCHEPKKEGEKSTKDKWGSEIRKWTLCYNSESNKSVCGGGVVLSFPFSLETSLSTTFAKSRFYTSLIDVDQLD